MYKEEEIQEIRIIRTAKGLLEQHGWIQGREGSPQDGGFCIRGAMVAAEQELCSGSTTFYRALDSIESCIEEQQEEEDDELVMTVAGWNDQPGRTFEQVAALLDCAVTRLKRRIR